MRETIVEWGLRACKNLLPFASLFVLGVSDAADFSYTTNAIRGYDILMEGSIEEGDATKLLRFINSDPPRYLATTNIDLSSDGGSVAEAIKIAALIERAALLAVVGSDSRCASACFLIYVSAQMRLGVGPIVVHRPYFPADSIAPENHSRLLELQQDSIHAMRRYLESRTIPSAIIDKMMTLPSNSGHLLSMTEIMAIGVMNPLIEELAIQQCGVSNHNFFSSYAKTQRVCLSSILVRLRGHFMRSSLGQVEAEKAIAEMTRLVESGSPLN